MSSRRSNISLNVSGFSPIEVLSPSSKSPGKDFGINERIEVGREKVLASFDRWKLAETTGLTCVKIIHILKEKLRTSNENPYPVELKAHCQKLSVIKTVFEDVIKVVESVRKEITGAIGVLDSMPGSDGQLRKRLGEIQKFLDILLQLYRKNLESKQIVVENIAHTTSSEDSHWLLACWSWDKSQTKIFVMIEQLRTSPYDSRWVINHNLDNFCQMVGYPIKSGDELESI